MITALKKDSLDGVARSGEVQYTVQAGDLSDTGEAITQGKTYSTTRRLDTLVILNEEDNLLEEFSKLSSEAEEILNSIFEVEPEASDQDKETDTEKIVDELLDEVISNISEADDDQTKPFDSNTEKPACTKTVSVRCTEDNAFPNTELEASSYTPKHQFSVHKN